MASRKLPHLAIFLVVLFPASTQSSLPRSHLDPSCGWRCGRECMVHALICDGYEQCDDDSDEGKESGQGCNLFPDSGCFSYEGVRHYKCERSGDCFKSEKEADECEVGTGPPVRECDGGAKWKCGDGRCVEKSQVCDGVDHCEDGSDEGREPYDGCNSFPEQQGSCYSWGGELFTRCPALREVCTTLEWAGVANKTGEMAVCRKCSEEGGWRCNDGRCIKDAEFRNGIPDCEDKSDEVDLEIEWFLIFVSTVITVSFGLGISFLCRLLNRKNINNFFHCNFCSSSKRCKVQQYNPTSARNRGNTLIPNKPAEEDMLFPSDDIPIDLIKMLEDETNWETKKKGRLMRQITGSSYSTSALKSQIILEAKRNYVLVHNDSIRYYHLYMYFANRCSTVKELAKVTNHLFSWEKEMHCHNKLEVIKCWRLHLGCSSLTSKIINSVSDEPSFYSRCGTTFYPVRQCLRSVRRSVLKAKPKEDSAPHKVVTLIYFSLLPFVGASLFYFELIKNLVFVHIFWSSLNDLSRDNPLDHPFEFSLVLFTGLAIATTQILFLVYSYYYAEDIFEVGHDEDCEKIPWKIIICKLFSIILSPLLPCYVLANHVYYEAKMSRTRRHLQTLNDPSEAPISEAEHQSKDKNQKERIKLYKNTCQLETKSLLYRKLYSYYRVTSAVLDSLTVIVVLILLMFVTGRGNRDINLIVGVEHRLASFFGITTRGSIVSELDLVRDVVISGSLLYSLGIVLTALVKYWYQAKNLAISWMGQTMLGLYMGFLTINKLTTAISIFSNTQLTSSASESDKPNISPSLAIFLFIVLVLIRLALVYFYKRRYSVGLKSGSFIDHWINVLVNTLVIIPFMMQSEPIRELKEKEKQFFFSPEKMQQKREELKRKTELLRIIPEVDKHGIEREVVESVAGLVMPNMNFFTAPLLYDDFRAEIINLWWENPSEKLELSTVKRILMGKNSNMKHRLLTLKMEEVDQNIRVTLEHLEYIGLVNTPLLNTAPTKREYFWLLLLVLVENITAVCIELASGGVKTKEQRYYSWDIRLASFIMALMFLLAYYKKYHITRDLTSTGLCVGWISNIPVCLCCKKDTWLAAPPNEDAMQEIISQDETDRKKRTARTLQTQTSFSSYSYFPPNNNTTSTMTSTNLNQYMEVRTLRTGVLVPQGGVQYRTLRQSDV